MDWKLLEDPVVRVEAMRDNFLLFFAYHYWREFTSFQKDWMRSIQSDLSTMIIAFRASRKTTIVRWYVVRCICYKKEPSIIRQSYEDWLSWESVREIAKMLCKESIKKDYWELFPFESKQWDFAKKSLTNFETTNWVKVASKSLGQTLRGANTYDMQDEISARPTLLILDDIDITKSVNNIDIINQNEQKITTETIGALDPLRRKIIFLWNVINEDWVVPRFRQKYKDSPLWNCFRQPLFNEKWENARPEVFTDSVVQVIKEDWKVSMNQNYLLIPSSAGSWVFTRSYFDYFLLSHFEQEDWILQKKDLVCWLFIDPAFSTSNTSDDACIIAAGEHSISKKIYILNWYADTSAQSRTIQAVIVMYNNMLLDWYKIQFISVEKVDISRQQTDFIKDLKDELIKHDINIPVRAYESKVKKETRIQNNLEGIMSMQWVKFSRNLDKDFLSKLERQFLEFPNADHDDIIDTVSQAVEVFKKKPEKQIKEVTKPFYNSLTWQPMQNNKTSAFKRRSADRRW